MEKSGDFNKGGDRPSLSLSKRRESVVFGRKIRSTVATNYVREEEIGRTTSRLTVYFDSAFHSDASA